MQLKPPAGVNRVVENGCLDGMGLMGNRRGDGGLGGGGVLQDKLHFATLNSPYTHMQKLIDTHCSALAKLTTGLQLPPKKRRKEKFT